MQIKCTKHYNTCQRARKIVLFFVSILSSWVPDLRQQAIIRTATQLAEPGIAPFRRMMPDLGGIDLSPVLPLILIECINQFQTIINWSLFVCDAEDDYTKILRKKVFLNDSIEKKSLFS